MTYIHYDNTTEGRVYVIEDHAIVNVIICTPWFAEHVFPGHGKWRWQAPGWDEWTDWENPPHWGWPMDEYVVIPDYPISVSYPPEDPPVPGAGDPTLPAPDPQSPEMPADTE